MFVLRYNLLLGIKDIIFIVLTTLITEILGLAFSMLPSLVLFAKITPVRIEATVFSLLTSVHNLIIILSGMIGAGINRYFVHVTSDDLSNFYILILI